MPELGPPPLQRRQFVLTTFSRSFNPISPQGPVFCVWEAKAGISDEEFQTFIDGPDGPNFGLNAFNNQCNPVNTALTGGATPYPPKFS